MALVDEADPAWHRRGMAFTNAWYLGNAELDGEGACFCASLKSMPSILARRMIAATTWSWQGIAAALETSVLVDARRPRRRGDAILRGRVPITIGVGAELAELGTVDVAIPTVTVGFAEPRIASGPVLDSASVLNDCISSTIEAGRHGRFMTERRIGDTVRTGEIVGGIGTDAVKSPASGVLLGLAARGARIEPGDTLVEVDTLRANHTCFGITEEARRTGLRVLEECEIRLGSSSCCNTRTAESKSHVMHEEHPQCASS